MIMIRRNTERHHDRRRKHEAWHTFYPAAPMGPRACGLEALPIFGEIRLPPGNGTAPQPGDDAEIVTYVHQGALAYEDSTGSSGVIRAGEFQRMSSGHGIGHQETNASRTDWAHVFRISLPACAVGLECVREQKRITAAERRNLLCPVASPDGRSGSLRIHQNAFAYSSILDPGHHLVHELRQEWSAWLHIIYGDATLHDIVLTQGDGARVTIEPSVSLTVHKSTEILLLDIGPVLGQFGSGVVR